MAVENFTLELDREAVETIRHALLIGLSCHAELERAIDRIDGVVGTDLEVDGSLMPRHPTGSAETTSDFATALAYLM